MIQSTTLNSAAISDSSQGISFKRERLFLKFLLFGTFFLIALGGSVRAMDAGLACPDWPLCFGKLIPEFEMRVYFEFIHRVIAGLIALATVVLTYWIVKNPATKRLKKFMYSALGILAVQIVMGGLTVLKLLHFGVVTAHLALGMSFFSVLLWTYFELTAPLNSLSQSEKMPRTFFWIFSFAGAVVFGQILLGGLVSSNYAGIACLDFPLCNGEFLPTTEGNVGLQAMHRIGAYFTLITFFSVFRVVRKNANASWMIPKILRLSRLLVTLVLAQIAVGGANVVFKVPPIITVVHLAVAASILGVVLRIIFLGARGSEPSALNATR